MKLKPTVMQRALRLYRKRPAVSARLVEAQRERERALQVEVSRKQREAVDTAMAFLRTRDTSSVIDGTAMWRDAMERLRESGGDVDAMMQAFAHLPPKRVTQRVTHWAQRTPL